MQFVGTLRVLRKPLAFRLPALGTDLGTIAVQVSDQFTFKCNCPMTSHSTLFLQHE